MGISASSDKLPSSPRGIPQPSQTSTIISGSAPPSPVAIPQSKTAKPESSPVMMIVSPTSAAPILEKKSGYYVPTVFSWRHGGKDVYLYGSFNNWKERIAMTKTPYGEFMCTYNLPPGTHHYGFFVDEEWKIDHDNPTAVTAEGYTNNIVEILEPVVGDKITQMPSGASTPPGEYGTEFYSYDTVEPNQKKPVPPALPPHLQRALLNTSPLNKDPTLLPLPHHVMLNHLYSLPRDDEVVIYGITLRYARVDSDKQKFVTTVMYKPATDVD